VKSKISCCLVENKLYPNNEDNDINNYDIDSDNSSTYSIDSNAEEVIVEKYNYNPDLKTHFKDESDPRRARFNSKLNYNRHSKSLKFKCKNVKHRYRNWQLADQMHMCCHTCYKYLKNNNAQRFQNAPKICRFDLPYHLNCYNPKETTIKIDKDKKFRKRVKAMPPRNNANINNCYVNPLIALAHNGNCDIQYMDNQYGACEYAASYSSKADEPDEKTMVRLFIRKIIQDLKKDCSNIQDILISDRKTLLAVAQAMQESMQVGSVQACAFIIKSKFVESSCNVMNINTLPQNQIIQVISKPDENNDSNNRNDNDKSKSVIYKGPKSQIGRRIAYSEICDIQLLKFKYCQPTLFSILSCYNIQKIDDTSISEKLLKKTPNLNKFEQPLTISDETGLVNNTDPKYNKFKTTNYMFTKYRKVWIINLSPKIPVDYADERSLYSTLILHCPYPKGGEENIVQVGNSIMETYNIMKLKNLIPKYVYILHKKVQASEIILQNTVELTNIFVNNNDYNENNSEYNNNNNDNNNNEIDCIDEEDQAIDNNLFNDEPSNISSSNNNLLNVIYPTDFIIFDNGVILPSSSSELTNHKSFIANSLKMAVDYRKNESQINEMDKLRMNMLHWTLPQSTNNSTIYDVTNKQSRLKILNEKIDLMKSNELCNDQMEVIEKYQKYLQFNPFDDNHCKEKQIIGFISGQGGTGKTEIIKILTEYANVTFGKTEGTYGQTLNCGPTGSSGNFINNYIYYF